MRWNMYRHLHTVVVQRWSVDDADTARGGRGVFEQGYLENGAFMRRFIERKAARAAMARHAMDRGSQFKSDVHAFAPQNSTEA